HRGAPAQQLFDDDKPLDSGSVTAAIATRQGHADPTPAGQLPRKRGVSVRSHTQTRPDLASRQLGGEELPDLLLQGWLGVGQLRRLKPHWQNVTDARC